MLKLVIADKNYSSWSMRPAVLMRTLGIAHEEVLVRLAEPDTAARIKAVSPSGRVPCLIDGGLHVWDSLAIIETLAERFPGVWPADAKRRAHARAVSAEMHSGFTALRQSMPMNIRHRYPGKGHSPDTDAEIARIVELWSDCLAHGGGPFLFGAFGAADAMYAPVVMRFETYAVDLPAVCRRYADAMLAQPAIASWIAEAKADPRAIDRYDSVYG